MKVLLWPPYVIVQAIIILLCGFFFLSPKCPYNVLNFGLLAAEIVSLRLISAVGDWMSTTLLHMVWP